ncbi:hypothetical protein D0T49_00835 [Paludibacter sp. 221]|uniref:VOC family protein n=1 Tax=Paludibacter sp. 221 TaxID=2302939 RepID=UPI0013D297DA|nr:VOC family protein [Paludibacter sp. 221]NDV45599.1 hypothetical protein [Paludibacter sp. 221]
MNIDHIAIWTDDLERLRDYYVSFFGGVSNQKYVNPKTLFESYFISFGSGARLEIMKMPEIPANQNDLVKQYKGLIHIAFGVGTTKEVDDKAEQLKKAGYQIIKGPRITGDGSYEIETLDPDNNRIEVVTNNI